MQSSQSFTYLPPTPMRHEPERMQALIVVMLTLACTVMSIYDLFLLAHGTA